jgi:hypothetical protein
VFGKISVEGCVTRAHDSSHLARNQHIDVIIWLARLKKLVALGDSFLNEENLKLFYAAATGNSQHGPIPHEEVNFHFAF